MESLDVKSLYKNIANNEDIKADKESFEKYIENTMSIKVIINLVSLILTLNNFVLNCTHYLLIMGYTMETICAPSCANMVMVGFEAKHISLFINEMSLLYLRYLDIKI